MSREKVKCPKCESDYLERKALTFTDRIIALVTNHHIRHVKCLNCLWEGRAHVSRTHRYEEMAHGK